MQAYGQGFARVYNATWQGFARQAAPLIRAYYEELPVAHDSRDVLDLCCGTGQLALHFLEHGYRVDGLDLSPHMLAHARENAADYLAACAARFILLNTRAGLHRWNNMTFEEGEAMTVFQRGAFDEGLGKAFTRITGFVRNQDGYYERFEELVYNTVFDLEQVRRSISDQGWKEVHFARLKALAEHLAEPEREPRVFVVARR